VGVFAPEALHPPGGIHQLLFTGEKGVAFGANLHPDALPGGTGGEFMPAGTTNLGLMIFRMQVFFHHRVSTKEIISLNFI
jgi:hypothetical protein